MTAKYQVFVSSTFSDLEAERGLVIKAILEMGHIPVGMEMFSAADEEQWNIIKKQIDQSDYYVVILAHRYGTCDSAGLSFTEKEYDYALSQKMPTLGFVLESSVSWPREKSETDRAVIERLDAFKTKVKDKPVSFWKNGEDLYGRCSIALMKAFNAYPREGWVRASLAQDVSASKELVRLSAENAELRARVQELESFADDHRQIDKVIGVMRGNTKRISVYKKTSTAWELGRAVTLYQIFEVLAPELQVEQGLADIARFVATNILRVPFAELRRTWPTPRNTIRSLLADLSALGCVEPSSRKKPVADTEEYWSLSEFGSSLLAQMRRRRLESVESLAQIGTTATDVRSDEVAANSGNGGSPKNSSSDGHTAAMATKVASKSAPKSAAKPTAKSAVKPAGKRPAS
jgi:hypothetical protein